MPVVDEPHGPARDPGELGRRERLEARALLGAEAAADELRPHPDVVPPQSERLRELLTRREHPLGRHPGGEVIAVPRGDGGVGLERRLHLGRRLDDELDRHLRSGEGRLGITAGVVRRVRGEALLVEGVRRVDDVCEHLEVGGERQRPRPAPPPACLPRRPRSAGRRSRARRREAGRGSSARARSPGPITARTTGDRESCLEVERADAAVGDGRAEHRRVEHARRAARRP